jgi:glycosyltransferase involved in cell wall biosynthesis
LLEAMACGRAIICSDIPGNNQLIVNDHNGLLVEPDDANELEHAIEILTSNDLLRLRLGQNAKLRASQFDEDKIFPKISQYYKDLTEKK